MSKKFLYLFKEGHDAFGGDQTTMKNTLGGKGAGLAEMTHAGMPVPQGFTITTEACTQYYADNREINDEIKADICARMSPLAVDMESSAVGQCAYRNQVPFLSIRCISDNADDAGDMTSDEFEKVAAKQVADVVLALVEESF